MNMPAGAQTFFPGHEDGDKVHVPSTDGTPRCGKCKMDLMGRGDLRISADNEPVWATLRRKNQLTARLKSETNQMTQQNLVRALKQLYPSAGADLEEKLKAGEAYEGRVQGYGQAQMGPPKGISIPFDQAQMARQAQSPRDALRAKVEAAEAAMTQGIAQKMGALTPGQRQAARQNAEKALAIALFHTDPRIHAHLLLDAANDEPAAMNDAMANVWNNDVNQWRTQAIERAARMVAIMDGPGKASL